MPVKRATTRTRQHRRGEEGGDGHRSIAHGQVTYLSVCLYLRLLGVWLHEDGLSLHCLVVGLKFSHGRCSFWSFRNLLRRSFN